MKTNINEKLKLKFKVRLKSKIKYGNKDCISIVAPKSTISLYGLFI